MQRALGIANGIECCVYFVVFGEIAGFNGLVDAAKVLM